MPDTGTEVNKPSGVTITFGGGGINLGSSPQAQPARLALGTGAYVRQPPCKYVFKPCTVKEELHTTSS